MSGLASGQRRDWVAFQRPVEVQDPDTGEMLTTWETYWEAWVNMRYQSAREFIAAAAEQSEVKGYALSCFNDDVKAKDRIVYRGKWFGILGTMPDNESGIEHMTIPYSEGVRLDQ